MMTADPAFWAILAGAAMIALGISPALIEDVPSLPAAERGCVLIILGIAVVAIAVGIKVLR